MKPTHKLVYPFIAIIGVIAFGTCGYILLEKWNFFDMGEMKQLEALEKRVGV